MALTATFAADFNRFERSIQQASVQLNTFDRATKTATRNLKREVESFSGAKITIEAARMVEAVNRLGGVTKLTDAEIKRLNATLTEAAQKAGRMGETLSPAIQKMRAEVAQLPKPLEESRKGFSLFSGGVGSVVRSLIPFATAAGAATLAVRGMFDTVNRGGQLAAVRQGFTALAGGVQNAEATIKSLRAGTRGLVADLDLMQASNKATLLGLGLNAKQMGDLAKTAQVLGRAMGQDATKSLDDLVTALGRSSPLILDNLGLTVKVGQANEEYAKQLRKLPGELTDAEKKQAFMNAAMRAAEERVDELGDATLTVTDRWQQFKTAIGNATAALGEYLVKNERVNDVLDDSVNTLHLWTTLLREGPGRTLEEFRKQIGEIPPEVKALDNALEGMIPTVQGVELSTVSMEFAEKRLTKSITEQIDASKKASTEAEKLAKAQSKAADEIRNHWNDIGKAQMDYAAETMREQAKLTEAVERMHRDLANEVGLLWMQMDKAMMDAVRPDFLSKTFEPFKAAVSASGVGGGGGGFFGNIFSSISGGLKDLWGGLTGGKGIGGLLGNLGSGLATGGLNSLLGAGLSAAVSGLKKLFGGVSEEVKRAREEVALFQKDMNAIATDAQRAEAQMSGWGARGGLTFIQLRDAIQNIGGNAADADRIMRDLLNTDNPERAAAAMEEFNRILEQSADRTRELADAQAQLADLQEQAKYTLQEMRDDASTLGIEFDRLGGIFKKAEIADEAERATLALARMIEASGDPGHILTESREAISKLVQNAMEFGTTLPENMREWIEELSKSGQLLDENGEAISDLSRLRFGERIKTEAEIISEAMERLEEVINRVADAIRSIPGIPSVSGGGANIEPPPVFTSGDRGGRVSFVGAGAGVPVTNQPLQIVMSDRVVADAVIEIAGRRASLKGVR